jgi:hypothetical protein
VWSEALRASRSQETTNGKPIPRETDYGPEFGYSGADAHNCRDRRLLKWMEDNDARKGRVVLDPDDVRAIRARAYTLRHIAIEHNETLKQVYECLVAFAACMPNNPIESRIAGIVTRLLIQLEPYKPKE